MGDLRSVSFLSISTLFFALVSVGSSSGLNQTVIVVSIDGLGWEFVGSKRTNTPNFDFFASGGVKAKNLLGIHPGKTFPSHTTFLTGLYPESHGIVDNKFWDPLYMEKFILEHDCSNFDPKFYNESEPIWLTMQKQGMRTGAFYWPGSTSYSEKPTFYTEPFCYLKCDDYKGPMLEYLRLYLKIHCFFDWAKTFQKRIDTVMEWLTSEDPPQLVMLYFEQPDIEGHKNGPNSETYMKKIEDIDREIVGYLVERLMVHQLMDKTNVILLSDHGIIETSDKRQIKIRDYIKPDSYFKNIAALEHIWPKPGKFEEIYAKLKKAENPHLKVYKKEEIPDEYHWKNNRRIPPIYLVAEEGWLMRQDYNPLAEGKWVEGTHGWPPTEKSAGIFYARGPAFKEGYTSNNSKRAIDIYALLSYIVGVKPLPNNGSLENMMEFLKKTPAPQHKESRGTTITSHTVFTPTITNHTRVSAQTKTDQNQWFTKESQSRQDSTDSHTNITKKTTDSILPLNQRTKDKDQHPRSGGFVRQHTEVNGNSLDRISRSSPQTSIKDTPTATTTTNQLQQATVLPQTETNSAMGIMAPTTNSLYANVSLPQDSVKRIATEVNEKLNEKTTGRSLHANLQTTPKYQKGQKIPLSPHRISTSEISSRSSDSNQTGLVQTSYPVTLDSKSYAHAITTRTLRALTDSKNSQTTPVLLGTPTLNSNSQSFIRTTTTAKTSKGHSNPSSAGVDTSVHTDESDGTLNNQHKSSVLVSYRITINDNQRFTKAILTTSIGKESPSSTVTHTPITTDTHSLLLSTSVQKKPDSLAKLGPLWNPEDNSFDSTKTTKTFAETNSPQIASPSALLPNTNADSDFSTTTLTKMTESNLGTSTARMDGNRANSKVLSGGKESDLGKTTPVSFISAKLTKHSEFAQASIDVNYGNTVTRTTKEPLLKTSDNDIMLEGIFLQQQQMESSGVATHTTENALRENVLRTKTPGVSVVSFKQVQTSIASSSSVIDPSNNNSNFTRNNISSNAFNSSMSNETPSGKTDENDFNTEALIDCPPGFEAFEDDDQTDEYSGNSNARSSGRTAAKHLSYLEAVIILIVVKLHAWLRM